MRHDYDLLIIGGGAAGFFTAINTAHMNRDLKIAILERGKEVLTKVKVSGGGRCNVTHAEFMPDELVKKYPRGEKELLGPFHRFMTGDTITWFEERGVALKIEEDGRMFPISDSSQTIIDCFMNETKRLGIEILKQRAVKAIGKGNSHWEVETSAAVYSASKVVIATGSNPKIWKLLEDLGHTIVPPVPSLFTFNINDKRITNLSGIATEAWVTILDDEGKALLSSDGPLLITHWGMSGPAILKLSAWGARVLKPMNYKFMIRVNWVPDSTADVLTDMMKTLKLEIARKKVSGTAQFGLPKRLWNSMVGASGIDDDETWADITKEKIAELVNEITGGMYQVDGKSTFKEEFVTAGGVELKEINFKTFESKLLPGMFFAGEVLNIDAITGGFNFQNAWTGGYLAAKAITE
ncbi:MAG: NAD(P)/FAD-dependent oxidoreductase [Bacteroidia bacterium]|nr:NAD(P)/FAD-dependent oxidoreductase [Bacteroidia bacterium]NNF31654.1 NAD(P)/FAD-dependent oxidoreductase [Flavobacteriaceae bacterium]MBT8276710.1 NAD(P)/FAD-dependent oxidoreductase [Bacteroidia bacterium]NNJ83158.1 NAD(P)/FAD-dependent oxidoreductase [Flavobacteriaceae bacterium]NNK55168.1 NAD(P)/FAD-dependent oxidoreductase [Flavobacteriaceae bacterium]